MILAGEPIASSLPPYVPRSAPAAVAILLSADSFEKFFGGNFNLDRAGFLASYRNDFAWAYAQGLAALGHAVLIYIFSYGAAALHDVGGGVGVRFLPLPSWLRQADRLLFRLQDIAGFASLRAAAQHAASRHTLLQALSNDKIDLLYVQEFWTARFDRIVRGVTAIPVIGADHGAPHDPRLDGMKRASLRLAARITCQSDENLHRATALGADAVLLTNGVDDGFFTPAPNGMVPREILAVGRLVEEQKRFSDMMRALLLLPDFQLRIIGSGPDEKSLRTLAARLGVAERIDFVGFVRDREVLRDAYCRCGVYVSASRREAMQLTMLEAMSCGAAVVATRIPSFDRLIQDKVNGRLVAVGDSAGLAEAIMDAYRNRASLGAQARATVQEHHSAGGVYDRLSRLIGDAVADHGLSGPRRSL